MESEDYSFYQGLEFLLESNIKDLGYDLTFSTEVRVLEPGKHGIKPLVFHSRCYTSLKSFGKAACLVNQPCIQYYPT